MFRRPVVWLLFTALGMGAIFAAASSAEARVAPQEEGLGPAKTVWDGVFTQAQAERGRSSYDTHCASCHREDLTGRSARGLVGSRFWSDWGDFTLKVLLSRTAGTMPRNAPGSLDSTVYADIVAYILEQNEFPSGNEALTSDSAARVRVVARDGRPQPISAFSLVTIAGCLNEGPRAMWALSPASYPLKTRDPYPSKTEVLVSSETPALAGQEVDLDDVYPDPSPYIGYKMEARGFLINGQAGQRVIKVTSLRTISPTCDQ
jgi:mono/diheme cytochrome c family protein